MGIRDEFNCCSEATTEENVQYLTICFERGYKPDLANPNALVKNGLRLVDGLFMGLNLIVPEFIISNNGFMKVIFIFSEGSFLILKLPGSNLLFRSFDILPFLPSPPILFPPKYWYDCLGIENHEFKLDTFQVKLSYYLHKSQFDCLMKLEPIYRLISLTFFYLLDRVLDRYNAVTDKIERKFGHLNYNFADENGEFYSVVNSAYKSNVKPKGRDSIREV